MLIRSQDGKTLTNFDFINIYPSENLVIHNPDENEHVEMIAFIGRGSSFLGGYSNEEKAMKVLNMIQEEYEKANTYYCDGYVPNIVFQMPQDDEVEV